MAKPKLGLVTPFAAGRTSKLPSDLRESAPSQGREPISEFLVPTHDAQGHSASLITRCPPQLKSEIQAIVAEHGSPFKDASAFLRWAVLRGARFWADQRKNSMVSNLQAILDTDVAVYQEQQYLMMMGQSVQSLTTVINQLDAMGKRDKARGILRDAIRRMEGIDDPEWRAHWLKEVRGRFGHMLKENGKQGGQGTRGSQAKKTKPQPR